MNNDKLQLMLLGKSIHEMAKEKGWWDKPREDGTVLMLIVTELAEAMEAVRVGDPMSKTIAPFSTVEEELADAIIRILDFAEHRGFELEKAIRAKMAVNANRPYRHGEKLA